MALPIVPIMSLTAKENPRSYTAASCHVSLVSFNVEQYFSLFFFPSKIFEEYRLVILWKAPPPPFWCFLNFLMIRFQAKHFWQEYHSSDVMFFSVHHTRRHTTLTCLNIGEAGFAILLKWCLLVFSSCYFKLAINKNIMGGYFEKYKNILLLTKLAPTNFNNYWWLFPKTIIIMRDTK